MVKKINICCASDDKYAPHMGTMIYSVLKNCSNPTMIKFYIIGNDLNSKNKDMVSSLISSFGSEVEFITIDKGAVTKFSLPFYFTVSIFYRLLVPKILELQEKFILYLDCDIIVNGDILEAIKYLPKDNPIAAMKKYDGSGFNSGVLIINIDKYLKERVLEKCLSFLDKNHKTVECPDQEALNYVLEDNYLKLPSEWNTCEAELLAFRKKTPIVVHFVGNIKPWQQGCNHPYRGEYLKYLKRTPWKNLEIEKKGLFMKIRERVPYYTWKKLVKLKRILKKCVKR